MEFKMYLAFTNSKPTERNLFLKMADHGFALAGFNRHNDKVTLPIDFLREKIKISKTNLGKKFLEYKERVPTFIQAKTKYDLQN